MMPSSSDRGDRPRRRLADQESWARGIGRAPATVKAYLYDPTGEKARAVKRRYQGVCRGCGAPTQMRNGKSDAYEYSKACHPGAIATRWTAARVRDAMRAWQDRYGRLPSAYDWSRTHARRRGAQALERLDDGDWPPASVVGDVFGTWEGARAAARADTSPRERSPAATDPLLGRRGGGPGRSRSIFAHSPRPAWSRPGTRGSARCGPVPRGAMVGAARRRRPPRPLRLEECRTSGLPGDRTNTQGPSTAARRLGSYPPSVVPTPPAPLRVPMKAARAPLRAPGLSAYLIGGGIERRPASGDRLGVVAVLHVEPAANQLSSHAGRQAPDSAEATRPMNKPVEDRDTGEMRVEPKTSLNLTLDFGVGSIACAIDLPQLASVPLLPRPLALLRFARPGEPGLAPFLLTLRPFFNVLIGWLSGHNAHPHSRLVCTPVRIPRPRTPRTAISLRSKAIRSPGDTQAAISRRPQMSCSIGCQSRLAQSSRARARRLA